MKSFFLSVFKIGVSIGSLYFVFRSIPLKEIASIFKNINYSLIICSLLVFLVAQVFSSLRFVYVARTLGGVIDLSSSLQAHFVGLWFNQVLPTSLGGDLVKVAILRRYLGLSIAVRSAILDRLSGLMFLLLATAIALPIYANIFASHMNLVKMIAFIAVGGGLFIILGAWTANRGFNHLIANHVILKLIQIFFDIWKFKKGIPLWEQAWTSAIVHFSGIITYVFIGLAFGVEVNLITFFLVIPVIFLITLIPVSYAGWGIREVGSIWIFNMVGIEREFSLAMSVSFGLLLVVAGIPGLFILIFKKRINKYDKKYYNN